MIDLSTTYLGLELKHPVVASAGPMQQSLDGIKRLEDAGAAAIVMFSLFEEQIRRENAATAYMLDQGTESFAEALGYFPEVEDYEVGPDPYLELVRHAVAMTEVPIIGSLNGVTTSGWTDYARLIEEAGAAALELNVFYIPADLQQTGLEVERRYVEILRSVRSAVSIPVAMKLSPFFSAFGDVARQLVDGGANGLVLFNRFYQPDFDLDALEVTPNLQLSTPSEIRLPLLWLAVLHGRIDASLAATTGVHTPVEVVKYLLAGADVTMTTSSLLKKGPLHIGVLVQGLRDWMEQKGYASVDQMKGAMSQLKVASPEAFERANYIKVLESFSVPLAAAE